MHVRAEGIRPLMKDLGVAGPALVAQIRVLRRHHAALLAAAAAARAPRGATGKYVASIKSDARGNAGTSHPAANRLEFGFHGVDSLGRRYDQGPRAHWLPALKQIEQQYFDAVDHAVRLAFLKRDASMFAQERGTLALGDDE